MNPVEKGYKNMQIVQKINGWTIIIDRLSNGDLLKRWYMGHSKKECIDRFKTEKRIIEKQLSKAVQ